MFKKNSFKEIISSHVRWILLVTYAFIFKKRYIFLSPPHINNQVLLDRVKKTIFKLKIDGHIDYATLNQIYFKEDYDLKKLKRYPDISSHYEILVKRGVTPLIVDCGGNIGLASRYFSDNYPNSKLLCIEPESGNLSKAIINNGKDVDFYEAAVGCESGAGNLCDPGLGNNAFQVEQNPLGELHILSINEILKSYPQSKFAPFIIKIDIEGFESDLFLKNTDWIDFFPVLIIELHDWMLPRQKTSANFLKRISELDRDFVFFSENIFSISNKI
ncbi:FkbM family methyltransferase [Polynucleobacter paneuropaeus]|nr:FkbM family methyltransferase [Polynucleobacter paneuropaeus]MBT8555583.1 FkbM family methyltransferase [Polynucleobacter paneuropaeus]